MDRSDSLIELSKALSRFQGAMHSVIKGSVNPYFKAKYADLDAVWDACRKPLSDNGLALAQATVDGDGKLFLETLLLHTSGEYLSSRYPLTPMRQVQGQGWVASDDPQSIGSAITYARRYAMSAMLGISADEDDDGEKATQKEEPTAAQGTGIIAPRGYCPLHTVPFVKRPGGVSKATGKPYPAFWACPAKVGRGYCQEKPQPSPSPTTEPPPAEAPAAPQEATDAIFPPEEAPVQGDQPTPSETGRPGAPGTGSSGRPWTWPIRGERESEAQYFLKVAREKRGLGIGEAYAALGKPPVQPGQRMQITLWTWTLWEKEGHTLQEALDILKAMEK